MRILIDSNLIISAMVAPNGRIAELLDIILKRYSLCIATHSIAETWDVVRRKFPENEKDVDIFFTEIQFEEIPFSQETPLQIPDIRDKDDKPILAAAIHGDVDILVTGDKDFEDVKIEKPEILTPAQFRRIYLFNSISD